MKPPTLVQVLMPNGQSMSSELPGIAYSSFPCIIESGDIFRKYMVEQGFKLKSFIGLTYRGKTAEPSSSFQRIQIVEKEKRKVE